MKTIHHLLQRYGLASAIFFISLLIWGFPHLEINYAGISLKEIGLSSDECFSVYHAQFPIGSIWKELSTGNNPPLFETVLHGWIYTLGDSSSSVHALSLILSALAITLIFQWIKTELESIGLATVTAGIAWSSNYFALIALEARAYTLLLLLGVISHILFFRAIKNTYKSIFNPLSWILWGLITAIMAYSHFFGLWIFAAQWIFLFWTLGVTRKSLKPLLYGFLGFLFLYAPYLPTLILRFINTSQSGTWVEPAPWSAPYLTLWKYFNNPTATILIGCTFCWGTFQLFSKKSENGLSESSSALANLNFQNNNKTLLGKYLFVSSIFPLVSIWLLSVPSPWCTPMFTERYTSFILPALIAFTAWSIAQIPHPNFISNRNWILTISLVLFAALLINRNPHQSRQAPAKSVVETLIFERTDNPAPVILEPYHAAFQVLYYENITAFRNFQTSNIYKHLQNQLAGDSFYILYSKNSFDSLQLSHRKTLYYTQLNPVKSKHTLEIETVINKNFKYSSILADSTSVYKNILWKFSHQPLSHSN